jgi:hypothetical protein
VEQYGSYHQIAVLLPSGRFFHRSSYTCRAALVQFGSGSRSCATRWRSQSADGADGLVFQDGTSRLPHWLRTRFPQSGSRARSGVSGSAAGAQYRVTRYRTFAGNRNPKTPQPKAEIPDRVRHAFPHPNTRRSFQRAPAARSGRNRRSHDRTRIRRTRCTCARRVAGDSPGKALL